MPVKKEIAEEYSANKPYLALGQKTQLNKSVSELSYAKTATNAENKTITFNKSGANQQSGTFQDGLKGRVRGASSQKKIAQDNQERTLEKPLAKNTFTYYMTLLERHHRQFNDNDYFSQIYKEHFIQSYQSLTFCKYLKPVDPRVLAQKKVFLPKRPTHKGKDLIVMIKI